MGHRLLAATAVMLMTTAAAWAEPEVAPSARPNDPDRVEARMEDRLEDVRNYSVEQKDQAMQAARRALDELDGHIRSLQESVDRNLHTLSRESRQRREEGLAGLKIQQQKLQARYHDLQAATANNWDAAKQHFSESWQAAKKGWRALTHLQSDDTPQ
ncbi:MAG: hypothetical protein R3292_05555 [Alcanivorax sp.]|nr:hypothetical protein [Alcanivorax sp.]